MKKLFVIILAALMLMSLAACSKSAEEVSTGDEAVEKTSVTVASTESSADPKTKTTSVDIIKTTANVTSNGAIDASEIFTDRDLTQNEDLSDAVYYTVSDSSNISVTAEGVYVISGSASQVTVTVDAPEDAKVRLILDGLSVTNTSKPVIYVKSADKVFVTTASGTTNTLSVTGTFTADGNTNTDAVIFSKDDLVLNGLGTLSISSTDNGISCKDDIKITGGTIDITCASDAIEAKDSIAICDGDITISTGKDGLHAEDDEDDTVGYIYICGGAIEIDASSDGIQATTVAQIDGGTINVTASEGIEATYVQINDGDIRITASDDGINASNKSSSYYPTAEFNGGYIYISMGQGDTDGIDANGNIYVNGGTLDIYAQSPFDYDGTAEYNGGTIIVNGTTTNQITNQFGGGMGGMGGGMQPGGNGGMQPGGNGGMGGGFGR